MSTALAVLEKQALELSPQERSALADRLLSSLFDQQGIEDAWSVEVERRISDIEAGRSALIPLDVAIARARAASR